MTKVISIRLNDEVAAQLADLAAVVHRPRSWLIEQAIAHYIEDEAPQVAAIRDALADYEAGTAKLVRHEDVMKRLDAKIRARLADV